MAGKRYGSNKNRAFKKFEKILETNQVRTLSKMISFKILLSLYLLARVPVFTRVSYDRFLIALGLLPHSRRNCLALLRIGVQK